MGLKIGKCYIIVFNIGNQNLTYTCKINGLNEYVEFIDKFGVQKGYKENMVVSFEEIDEQRFNRKEKRNFS